MADTYLNQKGAQHRAEKTKEWADARFVRYTTYNAVGVAGSGKNVSVLFPQTLYVPDGLIMGGTALSAGLATRGICGVTTPDGKGGCTKENLYLNYDGNNNYSRKVVLGAGSAGNEIANSSGAYTYSAVRGDQMVSYVTNYVPGAIKTWFDSNVHIPSIKKLNTDHSSALPVSSSEARSGSGSINLHKVSKTGKFSDLNNRGEAFLSWGGQNFAGAYGPIDSAMIADLGANRLAFMPPAGISVEYSRDSGTTWQNYGATDGQKLALTSTGVSFNIGKSDSSNKATEKYMLRLSLHTSEGKVYTQLNKFALYVSTNGSDGSYCTIRARTQNNYLNKVEKWDVFANKQSIAGWSGWNIINTSTITTYGDSPANQYGEIQFIFGCTAGSTTYAGLQIQRLMGFGGVGWTTPSNRAKYGTIYKYDYNQNAIFPKDIYVQSGATKEEDRYKVLVTGKTNTFTGTHAFNSGKIYLGQGDPNAIDLGSDGRINSGNSTLVGFVNKAFTLGHSSYGTNIRGSGTRPKYNGNDLARIIDLPKNYVTTNSEQIISVKKTFSVTPVLSAIKNKKVLGTDANGLIEEHTLGISDITDLQTQLNGKQPSGDYVPYDNASKDIYLGSHGIHSGTRPSSGGVTMAGNGYWIQESSVGVSSAVSGGVAVSSEMTPSYVSVSNGKIKLNSSGIVSDAGTFTFDGNPGSVATSEDLKNYQKKGNYVTIDTAQTITGRKTFNSPANVNGQEVATAIFKTSNGGQLIIGKEGPNSGTMLRFDQNAGTTRLQFRASATPGAMVWTQPEKGAVLYFDLTNSAGVSTRTTLDARNGTIARTSDIGNGKITIQKNGTDVGSFTVNQSANKTIDLTLSVSDVSGLQSALNGKANTSHTHSISQITNLQTTLNGKANTSHTHAISDVIDLQTRLDGKMDMYTITSKPSSMSKDGFAQFGNNVTYKLTQYYDLSKALGYVRALDKGGQVSNNNSYFTCLGDVGGGTYIGTAVYDRDYNSTTDALYTSHGLLIGAYGSAFLLSGSRNSENIKQIATTDDTKSLQNSIDGKQAKLVSGTNIRTINGTSILGAGNITTTTIPSGYYLDLVDSDRGINFSSNMYVTNMCAGRINLTLGTSAGSEASGSISFTDSSKGRGTWYVAFSVVGTTWVTSLYVTADSLKDTGCSVWARRTINVSGTDVQKIVVSYIAIKYW